MLVGQTKKKGQKRNLKEDKTKTPPFEWGPDQQESFENLVRALTTAPVLAFADFSKSFVVHTDASSHGLGAVLSQENEGRLHPIAYASRGLSPSEKNYPAHKLEFLAMKWAICDKFHDYLYAAKFQVITDNNPLTYVMSSAKLDATGLRWVSELSMYDFSLKYRPGRLNQAADALSRIDDWEELDAESVRAVCSGLNVCCYVSCLAVSEAAVPDMPNQQSADSMTRQDWVKLQREDQVIRLVSEAMETQDGLKTDQIEVRKLWRQRKQLVQEDGVLYRKRKEGQKMQKQVVLPKESRKEVLTMLHDDMGHLGRDRVLELARSRFYWTGMREDVEEWIGKCDRCLRRKQPTNQVAGLEHLTSVRPMELVCMDFLSLEPSVSCIMRLLLLA